MTDNISTEQLTINVVTSDEFKKHVINESSSKLVLVDFWASWCAPCKQISPIMDRLAASYKDTLKIVKINIDEARALASEHHIKSIPFLLLYKDGLCISKQMGAQKDEAAYKAWIMSHSS